MAKQAKPSRFVEIYSQQYPAMNKIFVDTVTGVNYFWHQDCNIAGLTVLLNADGTPVVTPPEMLIPR